MVIWQINVADILFVSALIVGAAVFMGCCSYQLWRGSKR